MSVQRTRLVFIALYLGYLRSFRAVCLSSVQGPRPRVRDKRLAGPLRSTASQEESTTKQICKQIHGSQVLWNRLLCLSPGNVMLAMNYITWPPLLVVLACFAHSFRVFDRGHMFWGSYMTWYIVNLTSSNKIRHSDIYIWLSTQDLSSLARC